MSQAGYVATPGSGVVNMVLGGANIVITGTAGEPVVNVGGTTNHSVQVGTGGLGLTSISVGTNGQVLIGATGADPAFGTITSTGGTLVFTTGPNTLNIETAGEVGISYVADTGSAVASMGVLDLNGGNNISTSASGNQVLFNVSGTTQYAVQVGASTGALSSLSLGTAGAALLSGGAGANPAFVVPTAGNGLNITTDASHLTYSLSSPVSVLNGGTGQIALTSHYLLIGNGTSPVTLLAPSAASGIPLISQGSSSDPAYGIATVPGGGTGDTSLTLNGVMYGNGTSAVGVTAAGTNGQVLTATTGSAPSWQTPASTSITITGDSGGGLVGNSFIFTGSSTGLTFAGAGSTETLGGILVVSNGGTGRATLTNHGLLVGAGTSAITQLANATNGQLPIGSTGADPVLATITAGTNIAVTNGAGSISLATTGAVADSFVTDSGTATPSAGVLNVLAGVSSQTCGSSVQFTGSGSTVQLNVTDSNNNTIIGKGSGNASITGAHNQVLGNGCFAAGTSGFNNVVIGNAAGAAMTSGADNVAIGNASLAANVSSNFNVGVGGQTLQKCTGASNTALGNSALANVVAGSNNIGIAGGSGYTAGESSNIAIGAAGTAAESNVLRLGTNGSGGGQQSKCFIAGIDGVNVGSVAKVVTEASNQLGTATITGGTGISVTPTANTITIAATGTGFAWNVVTTNQTLTANNGYMNNAGSGTTTFALPAAAAVGDTFRLVQSNAGSNWQVTQGAGQQIQVGNVATTSGATGTLTSTAIGDAILLVCFTANTGFIIADGPQGNLTIV